MIQFGFLGHPFGIVAICLVIFNTIIWSFLIYRYWQLWKTFKQYETPFFTASIAASVITLNYTILLQVILYGPLEILLLFLAAAGIALAIYFIIGGLLARQRDLFYSRFVDNLLRGKLKQKQISRTAFLRGRYTEEILQAVQKHPRTTGYSTQTWLGYMLTGLTAVLLIPLLTDPTFWVPPIPYYLVPYPPNLLGYLIIIFAISLFITGFLILAEKWPYAGLATIILTILTVTAIIHLPHLLLFQLLIFIAGILGGLIPLTKQPATHTKPTETPSELHDLVPPQPPLTPAHKTAYIGGGIVLTGAILTISANIGALFVLFFTYPMLAMILGIPLHQLILANLLWITMVTTLSVLALLAAGLIFRQDWKTGGILALICGILTIWMIWGIITLIGAIIVLAKHPKNENKPIE